MTKALKRSLSILLAIVIIFSFAYVGLDEVDSGELFVVKTKATTIAGSDECGNDLTLALDNVGYTKRWYIVNDNVGPYISCTVKADGTIDLSEFVLNGNYDLPIYLEIPEMLDGYKVTSVGENLLKYNGLIYTVKIPDTVTTIGNSAFYNCYNLREVKLSNSLTEIPNNCFQYCMSLSRISIPKSVKKIGKYAFGGCAYSPYVNYTGSVCEWNNINIGAGNTSLDNAEINYAGAAHVASDWIIDKNATVNSTGLKHKECTVCGIKLQTAVIPQLKPATPKLSSVANTPTGVKFTWGKVTGADSYAVYRRTYNASTKTWSGWANIAKGVKTNSYLDTTAKTGTYYIYTVRAGNEAGYSGYNATGLKIYFLSTPTLASVTNSSAGVTVKWGKVTGATSYVVYRRAYNATTKKWSGWTNLGKTTATSFADKTAKSGNYYIYTVKALAGTYTSAYNTTGLKTYFLSAPALSKVASTTSGVKFTWGKVTGASGYIVYRKTYNASTKKWSGWSKLATVAGNSKVSYVDKSAKKGTYYVYTTKAYYGSYTSAYNTTGLKVKDIY